MEFALVGIGGALGSMFRYGLTVLYRHWAIHSVLATFTANLVGCFLIGLWAHVHQDLQNPMRQFLTVGLLGGFTTFSSLAFETHSLYVAGGFPKSVLYLLGTNLICLVGFGAGYFLSLKIK